MPGRRHLRGEFDGAGQQGPSEVAGLHAKRLARDLQAAEIVGRVARTRGLTVRRLLSSRRGGADVAEARQLAMYLLHVGLGRPQHFVGLIFRRDPSTVSYACHVVEDRRDDPAFEAEVCALEATLEAIGSEGMRYAG